MNILVLSSTASAINYINVLAGQGGLKLFVTDCNPVGAGLYMDSVHPLLVPRARNSSEYRKALDGIIRDHQIDVLIPTSDHDVEGVMDLLAAGWDPPVRMFKPDYQVYRTMSDKAALMDWCRQNGVPAPYTFGPDEQVTFPAIVKPAREGGGKGVWKVNDAGELEEYRSKIQAAYGDEMLVQTYIEGGLGSIYVVLLLYNQQGELCQEAVTQSRLTLFTWGGGGNAGVLVDEPELMNLAKDIVAKLGGWRGPINLEFKRCARSGQSHLLEINCRLNGYSYLTSMNGLVYPQKVLDILTGVDPLPAATPYPEKRKNFILGFREKPVKDWVAPIE